MRAIFVSYRRSDTEGQAGRLFDDLKQHFGADAVFMDVAGMEAGRDFRKAIDEHVSTCGVLLAIIGKSWLTATNDQGVSRITDSADYVRLETASALKRDIPVVPVLVQGARMPTADQLPDDLKELTFRNAVELTHARWDSDVALLIKALQPIVERTPAASKVTPPAARPTWFSPARVAGVACVVLAAAGFLWFRSTQADRPIRSETPKPADTSAEPPPTTTPAGGASPVASPAPAVPKPKADIDRKRAPAYRNWNGHWKLEWKYADTRADSELTMRANPSGITGFYSQGVIEGRFVEHDFSTVLGEFTNTAGTSVTCASGKQTGSFQLTMDDDGKSMDGWWDVCGEGTRWPWKAIKQ